VAEKDFALAELFLFDGAAEALADVGAAETAVYRKGDLIYDSADCPRALGVLLRGNAEALSPAREAAVLSSFGPGAVFGAAALFGMQQPYVSRIRAVTDCTVRFLPEAMLEQMFLRHPRTALNYIAFLSSRVRLLNGKIAVLEQNDAEGRLYRYLTENCDENGRLPARMTMTRLAATLNMGRTSLYRAMESLSKKKLIVRKDGETEVMK
jgi:CRP-like cAMP-binding protein